MENTSTNCVVLTGIVLHGLVLELEGEVHVGEVGSKLCIWEAHAVRLSVRERIDTMVS